MSKQSKNLDFYKLKNWCDAKDETGVWRVGRIKRRDKTRLHIVFDGWSETYKRIYCIHSDMIAPFRMHTVGYTGQKTKALRDWDFGENTLKFPSGLMSILSHSNFTGLAPYELTTFVRGDLYILIDCLMCHNYGNPNKEVNEVMDFFRNVVSLIMKWISVVPNEMKQCDFDRPDAYIHSNSDAICKGIFEVTDMLCNIFGFNPRTAVFYERNKSLVNCRKPMQQFLNERGMDYFISLIKLRSVGLEQIWHIIIHIPTLFNKTTGSANDKYIRSFTDSLINKFEVLPPESLAVILENSENVNKFIKNFEGMIELVCSPYEKENFLEAIGKFFKIRKDRESDQPSEMTRISLLPSPRHKPPAGPMRSQRSFVFSPPKQAQVEHQKSEGFAQVTSKEIQDLIDKKYEECVKLIDERLSIRKLTEENMQIALQGHYSCDQQEFSILSTVEFLLSEGKTDEALRVIRWRKKILKVGALNGWDAAREVARRTIYKLDVTVDDVIEANFMLNSVSSDD